MLKKKFVKMTQLDCRNPAAQKKLWQMDLKIAGNETIAEVCPNWQTDRVHRIIRDMIFKEMTRKKSSRPDWLREAAFTWLESLPGEFLHAGWYPGQAIRIAHYIFLRGSAKFSAFVNCLRKRKSPMIFRMLQAWEATQG